MKPAGQQNSGVRVYLRMGVYSALYGTHICTVCVQIYTPSYSYTPPMQTHTALLVEHLAEHSFPMSDTVAPFSYHEPSFNQLKVKDGNMLHHSIQCMRHSLHIGS